MTGYINLESVRMRYGDHTVVRGLDLAIPEGALLTLLGPSGCGKTTTLRAIAGLERLSGGRLSIDTQTLDCPAESTFVDPDRRSIGMVFQSYALWPQMTVRQNVAYPMRIQKVSKQERTRRVDELLSRMGLDGLAERVPGQLSGGQQQRVAVARALAREPRVLLFDEPLSNLDARLRKELRAEIRRVHQRSGATSVFVTHDQEEAMAVSDLVGVVLNGRLVQLDSPEVVYRQPRSREIAEFLGFENLIEVESGQTGRLVMSGTDMPVPVAVAGEQPPTGGILALRREQIRLIDDADPRQRRLKAIVTTSTYVGGVTEFEAGIGEVTLRCAVRDDDLLHMDRGRPEPGEAVLLAFPQDPQQVLPARTTGQEDPA